MVARNLDHDAALAAGRHAEGVPRSLHHERRHLHGVELGEPGGGRGPPARRGGCSGNARQSTATASLCAAVRQATLAPEERPPAMSGSPRSGPPRRWSATAFQAASSRGRPGRGAASGHAVGLLDQGDADAGRAGGARDRDQVAGGHPSAGAVPEHQRADGRLGDVQVRPGRALGGVDLEWRHADEEDRSGNAAAPLRRLTHRNARRPRGPGWLRLTDMSDEPPLERWARQIAVLEAVRIARRSPFEDFERDVRPRLARLTREQLRVMEESLVALEGPMPWGV